MTEVKSTQEDAKKTKANAANVGWLILSVIAAIAMFFLFPKVLKGNGLVPSTGKLMLAAILSIPASYIGALIGNVLRKIAMPDAYFTSGMADTLKKRFFWAVGPQLIGVAAGQLVVWLAIFSEMLKRL